MSAPRVKGYGSTNPKGIQSHVSGHAGMLADRAVRYFGIDPRAVPGMSDQELSQLADRAIAMENLTKILPIVEKHFRTLIEGQVEYEQFCQRVYAEVAKGSKQIDKTVLDAWLLSKGYDKHLQLMNQKAGHGMERLNAEFQSEYDLNRLDFRSAIKLIHLRHQNKAKAIGERVPRAINQMKMQEALRHEAEERKELLEYGTKGKPGKGFMANVKAFFRG